MTDAQQEMRPDAAATLAAGSPDRFGYEWHNYAEMRPEYEEQFRRWTVHLRPEDWRGLRFLDVGCGMGRNAYWPMTYGAAGGLAIDVDDRSLTSARQTLARFPDVKVAKRSAYEIGCEDAFDITYAIGVIHHLQEPERALTEMVRATKPGGRVLIWVYGRENNERFVAVLDPLRKTLFSRLPVAAVHHLSLYPTALLWLLLRAGFGRIAYFDLLRRSSFRHQRSIVFDQMLPKIAHYWPRQTVAEMLAAQGLVDVKLAWVNEMSWSAIGTKPTNVITEPLVETDTTESAALAPFLDILRCPDTHEPLLLRGGKLVRADGARRYRVDPAGIPLFAEAPGSADVEAQRRHYNKIAAAYAANLEYPHTQEYLKYLDRAAREAIGGGNLGTVVELCCGRGEGLTLFGSQSQRYVGVDISEKMLSTARSLHRHPNALFVQADATRVPLAEGSVDTVVMLGGIHHVPARTALFAEIARILKPGGRLLYREPVSDLWLWRALRGVVYRISPMLDHGTERPLRYQETVPLLEAAGLRSREYRSYGLIGFCLFMNSDVLFFNRFFRFLPGIRCIARASARIDAALLSLPHLERAGLQVIGIAEKR